ncbi:TPA: hypothetical protein ACGSFL_000412 [Escherichia coli]
MQAVADLKAGYTLGRADVAILNELARIALASLEAQPVAYIRDGFRADGVHFCGGIITAEEHERTKPALSDRYTWKHQPLYTALPAPVANEYLLHMAASAIEDLLSNKDRSGAGVWADVPAKLRRAATLQGADGTLTNEGTIPANTPCKDAPEHIWLQTAGVWPENGEFSELTWCSDNQHKDDTLYVRGDVVTGNSPVIQDGWVMVPVEPTEDMIVNGFESEPNESFSDERVWEAYDAMSGCQQAAHRAKLCWAAMISAAPKPDVR